MSNYIIYNNATGVIISTQIAKEAEAKCIILPDSQSMIEGVADVNNDYIADGIVVHLTPEQVSAKNNLQYGYAWDPIARVVVKKLTDEQITTFLATKARAKRDLLLNESIIWSDTSYTGDVLASWLAYREVLKNITSQAGFPGSIVWPTKPA